MVKKGSKLTEEQIRKNSESHRGQIPWHKGLKGVYSEETLRRMAAGRALKRTEINEKISKANKGHVAWNKGLKGAIKLSDETLRKMSEAQKGKKRSDEAKANYSRSKKGDLNPMKREDVRRKVSIAMMGRISPRKGAHASDETKRKCSEGLKGLFVGNKHPNWRGGISFVPYCPKFNLALKEKIRDRDNRTCQSCGKKENGRKLTIHHIHYDKPNCEPDLIALCCSCNGKVNYNRDYWEVFFMQKLKDRGLV